MAHSITHSGFRFQEVQEGIVVIVAIDREEVRGSGQTERAEIAISTAAAWVHGYARGNLGDVGAITARIGDVFDLSRIKIGADISVLGLHFKAAGGDFHPLRRVAEFQLQIGKTVACGGLLSVLKGQKEVFFFDVSKPSAPKFVSAARPPLSSITDEFHALPSGGFLVTMMGGAQGHAPGRVVEFDQKLNLVNEYPDNPPQDGFNPHGISLLRPEINLMVTSDFVCPTTTLHAVPMNIDFRGSVRGVGPATKTDPADDHSAGGRNDRCATDS